MFSFYTMGLYHHDAFVIFPITLWAFYDPYMIPQFIFFDSDPKCPHMKLERNSHNGRFGNGWWEKFNDVDFHAIH